MKKIKVYITTNYFCNFDCEYCYLGCLREDKKVIDPMRLRAQLENIAQVRDIEEIIVAGGESTLLPLELLMTILYISKEYTDNVVFVTNFSNTETAGAVYKITDNISVSVNKERPNYEATMLNILSSELENLSISIVVTPGILAMDKQKLIYELEMLKRPVFFLQYSPSIYNDFVYPIQNSDYESFLKEFIAEYIKKPRDFELINLKCIESCLDKNEEPWQDSVIFIDPYNRLTALEYTRGREYFREFKSIRDIEEKSARQKVYFKAKCGRCEFFGNCYAEHIKDWNKNDSCCGMKGLLEWYEKNLYQNN